MSDELVNTLENLGLFFGGATGRLTRDYGELSGDNFQMMAMHTDPEKLAKDLASLAEAAARIRLLEQQLSTAREEALEEAAAKVDNLRAHLNFEQFLMILRDKTQAAEIAKAVMAMLEANAAAIRSLGEPSAHPPGE